MTEFNIIPIIPSLTVSRQLQAADFAALAAKGVHTIINNCPDGEEPGQLTAAEADGPVHAHCRSGQRSATLWMLGEIRAGRMSRDNAQKRLETAGLDPKPGLAWLDHQDAGST